jgi:oligopeptide/dipeptide ABC transporter ATP-binding protein
VEGTGAAPLLELDHVSMEYALHGLSLRRSRDRVHAVSDVSIYVGPGECVGLVGESGCGKSTTARLAVALERPTAGRVLFEGRDLAGVKRRDLRRLRRSFQVVFQDPYSSLDPKMNVEQLVAEPFIIQKIDSRADRGSTIRALLAQVGIASSFLGRYPHQLSGGQRQRVALARSLALRPKLIVADEPVSALDVSVRAQILNLMMDLQEQYGLSYLIVSHDLAIVRHVTQRVAVMYLGQLVEQGPTSRVIENPAHPYTARLISAVPDLDPNSRSLPKATADEPPSPIHPPSGCRFRTRCEYAQEICAQVVPELRSFGEGQEAACHFPLRRAEAEAGQ